MEKIVILVAAAIFCLLQAHSQHIHHQDVTTVSFSKSSYVINKLAISPPVTLVLNDSLLDTIAIRVVDREGTAIRGEDYRRGPYDITFTANKTRFSFSNGIVKDDIIVEEDEYFTLIIDPFSLPSGIAIGEHDRTTVIIDDDDSAVVFFGNTKYHINESQGLVRSSVHLSKPLSSDLNVTVINKDGNAIGDQDYNVAVHTITFSARKTNVPFYIQIINDDTLEDPEDLTLSFESVCQKRVSVTSSRFSQSKVIIMDDNVTTITTIFFNQSTYSIDEDSGVIQLMLVISNSLSTNVTVQVTDYVKPALIMQFIGRPIVRYPDYTVETHSVTFTAGETIALLNVMINDDNIHESIETFTFAIDPYSLPINGITIGYPYQTTVTIIDDDPPNVATISFTQSTYSFKEDSNVVQPVLVLSNPLTTDIIIEVVDREDTATEGRDYVFETHPITFTPGMTIAPFNVTLIDDYICGNRTFILTINPFAYSLLTSNVMIGNPSYTTVGILDDVITVSFSNSSYSVSEVDGHVEIALILSKPSLTDITVIVTDMQGTATGGGMDYASGPYSIVITAGHVRESFRILVRNEREMESNETFTLTIDTLLQCEATVDDRSQTVVNIEDDDVVVVSFNESAYNANENNEQVQPVLVLSQPSSTDISVLITVLDGNATGGLDYNYSAYITIPADVISVQFTISIINDDLMEGNEYFILFINPETLPLGVFSDYPDASLINIRDDDSTTLSFKKSSYLMAKNSTQQSVQVILDNPLPFDLTIEVTDIEGTATRGEDYTFGPYYVTFAANATVVFMQNLLYDDDIVEKDEYFTLTINLSSLPVGVYAGNPSHTRIIIRDDDSSFLFFESSSYTVEESNGFIQILLLLSNPLSSKITVMVTDDPENATRGNDYIAGPYNITIAPGLTRVPFIVNISKDYELDDSEYLNLAIVPTRLLSSNRVALGLPNQTEVIITDNIVICVFFNVTTYDVGEKAGTVTLVLSLTNPSSTDITLQVTDVEDTATRDVDYGHGGPYNVTILAGQTNFSFDISVIDDDILEGNEKFILIILAKSSPSDIKLGDANMSTVTIVDDDTATVRFQQQAYIVNESNERVQVVLTLSSPSSTNIVIEVIINDGSAIGGGEDYHSGPYSVKFIAGMTEATLNVSIVDDLISESSENFTLTINASSLPNKVFVSDYGESTLTIVDNDVVLVFFNVTTYSVGEKAETVTLALSLTNPSSTDITLQVIDVEDTATRGVDYGARGPYSIIIPAGRTTVSFNVTILDDNELEENENFNVVILAKSLPSNIILGDANMSAVIIVDDDTATVSFQQQTYTVNESNDKVHIVLTLSNPSSTVIVIEIINTDGSAIGGGEDYHSGPYNVKFIVGMTEATLNVSIVDDLISEGNKNFTLTINASSLPNKVSGSDHDQATVTIVDNDVVSVFFNVTMYGVGEKAETITLVLSLTNPSSADITLQVTDVEDTATRSVDYGPRGPYNVIIPAGRTRVSFDISIFDDNVLEENENFILTILAESLPSDIRLGDPDRTTVIIVDDDNLSVFFNATTHSVSEDGGSVTIVLLSTNPSSTDITIQITSNDGNAIGGVDYRPRSYNATIPAGQTMISFDISILDDNILEENEDFYLIIIAESLPNDIILGDANMSRVTIVDDDTAGIFFNKSVYIVNETDSLVQPELVLTIPSSTDITIQVTVGGGIDYHSGPYNVTFPAGVTFAIFNVSINDDDIIGGNENFTLSVDPSSLPNGVTVGNPGRTIVIVVNDDFTIVSFNSSTYTVYEDGGQIQPVLVLSNPSSFDIIVNVTVIGETPDYNSEVTVIFTAGVTTAQFNISIIDNNLIEEENELLRLFISLEAFPSGVYQGNPYSAVVLIIDDDIDSIDENITTVSFENRTYSVDEDAGAVQPVLVLSSTLSVNVTLQILNIDGIATGIDYGVGPYSVTFPAGSTRTLLDISINDDDIVEGIENFTLIIDPSSPLSNVTIGHYNQTTVTILDNDYYAVGFQQSIYDVHEYTRLVQIKLLMNSPVPFSFTVQVIAQDGSATGGGIDYEVSRLHIIRVNETAYIFDVLIIDDNVFEGSENFSLTISTPLPILVGELVQTTVTIVDNDPIDIFFNESTYDVLESDQYIQLVLVLSNPSATDITIQVTDNNGTTRGGFDYDSGPYNVTFPAGETFAVFNVSINDDDIVEGNENFTLSVDASSLPNDVTVIHPHQSTVTITDNDFTAIELSFNKSKYDVNESSEHLQAELVLSSPLPADVTIQLTDISDSATGGADYDSGPFNITIPAGETLAVFNVSINDDDLIEGNENFTLSINTSLLPSNVVVVNPVQIKVTIFDDDFVFFNESTYKVAERNGYVQPVIVLSKPSSANVSVQVINIDGTATGGGVDYDSGPFKITIPAGETFAVFNVSINDDNITEENESFSLFIDPSSLPGSVDQATVNIVDNDYIVIAFDELIYSVDENSRLVQPILVLSVPLTTDITIQVIDNNDTAARSIDYASGPFNVVFHAGVTRVALNVSINDDSIVEDNEHFTLSINPSLLPNKVIIGNAVNVTVTVIDDDNATVSFEQSSYTVNENSLVVNPVLVVSNLVSKRFDIRVTATDGSATGRKELFSSGISMLDFYGGVDDYDLGPFFIRMPPKTRCSDSLYAKCAPFIVLIRDDDVYEGNENFILTIQASLPANITIGELSQTTVTIVDNDPIDVFFTESVYRATERSGFVQFVLVLSNPSIFDITIQVNGTETRNSEYAPGPYSVTFIAGDVVAEFNISVRDDLIKQSNKNFTLNIDPSSLPHYVSIVEPSSAKVIVMDDDDCTINRVSIRARPRSAKRTVIKFSSDNINATYTCSLNGNTFSKCKSPLILTDLSKGTHNIKVRAYCFGDSVWAHRSRLEFDIS